MRATAFIAATLLTATLAACGTTNHDDDPFYDSGFQDGCSTGTSRTPGTPPSKAVRDDKLWEASEGYRAGWRAGYNSCSGNRTEIPGSDRR